ncbi:ATP-binding cassette domain-containing protein [Gluconacetobacter sacchari]|uniref:ATP-binding cassette domain-containing protein n=1 Tax=Gluconacetobacter sacchari TaxID=92759 RepID=A0A7W4NQ83_9PROT|nr:ATP-binding cassette domain-containing protein [Gluconacetobacter sacchari]MBB2162284.1 ATP-binding cassette domain-containing protein [Gluconacetobacter sacchari]
MSIVEELGLARAEIMDVLPYNLSVGQQKKVAIALALSREADLYVFDEPLANLDDYSGETVMNAIFRISRGKTLLVIMHGAIMQRSRFDFVYNLTVDGLISQ